LEGSIGIGAPHSLGDDSRQLAQGGHVDAVKWLMRSTLLWVTIQGKNFISHLSEAGENSFVKVRKRVAVICATLNSMGIAAFKRRRVSVDTVLKAPIAVVREARWQDLAFLIPAFELRSGAHREQP
jgi:hypothetical protein